MQIDADSDQDPSYKFEAYPDPAYQVDADPDADPQLIPLIRIRSHEDPGPDPQY
jgi:hypothetical protein